MRSLRGALLRWYRKHHRDLPWRRTRDPYAIWVSEIMLQQTQVATVIPYYERFLQRFPAPAELARAAEEEVLAVWSGLGYYRRARSLQAGARAVMERHGGLVPRGPEQLLALPGVGRYTAGAIASIAFGLEQPVLDGNVRRVLSRLHCMHAPRDRELWPIAERLVQGPDPGDLNQALMELGAMVCTPRAPRCPRCPLRRDCRAFARGDPETFPAPKPAAPGERVRVAIAWIRRAGRLLLERPPTGSPLRGTWDLPALELGEATPTPAADLRDDLARRYGLDIAVGEPIGRPLAHGIMNRRLRLEVFCCRVRRGRASERDALRWVAPGAIETTAVSGATRKVARAVAAAAVSE